MNGSLGSDQEEKLQASRRQSSDELQWLAHIPFNWDLVCVKDFSERG